METIHNRIVTVLFKRSYMTSEEGCQRYNTKYKTHLKVSNFERRLREAKQKGLVENASFKNKHNSSSHKRWKAAA